MSNRRKGTKKESGGGGGGDGDAPLPPPPPSSSGGRSSSALQAMAALGGASHVTNAAAAAAAAASATSSSRSRSRGGGAGSAGIGIGAAVAPRTGVRYGLSRGASSSARYHRSIYTISCLTRLTQRSPTLAHLSPFIAGVLQLEGVLDQRYDKAKVAHAHTHAHDLGSHTPSVCSTCHSGSHAQRRVERSGATTYTTPPSSLTTTLTLHLCFGWLLQYTSKGGILKFCRHQAQNRPSDRADSSPWRQQRTLHGTSLSPRGHQPLCSRLNDRVCT